MALGNEKYSVDWTKCLAEAEAALRSASYSLLLVDLGLPDGDGLDFLKRLRRSGDETPAIVLTARGELNDRIEGLDGGADDYLVKPFAIEELTSRCRAIMRRPPQLAAEKEDIGNISLDTRARELRIDGIIVDIPRREFMLLNLLVKNGRKVTTRSQIENDLYRFDELITANAIDASASRLRKFLRLHRSNLEIRSIRGVGYRLSSASEYKS